MIYIYSYFALCALIYAVAAVLITRELLNWNAPKKEQPQQNCEEPTALPWNEPSKEREELMSIFRKSCKLHDTALTARYEKYKQQGGELDELSWMIAESENERFP